MLSILPLGSCTLVSKLKSGASYKSGGFSSNKFIRANLPSKLTLLKSTPIGSSKDRSKTKNESTLLLYPRLAALSGIVRLFS